MTHRLTPGKRLDYIERRDLTTRHSSLTTRHAMSNKPEDICPRPDFLPPQSTEPMAPPLYTAAVYRCRHTAQAEALLSGDSEGYVYVRDGHPNADLLAGKCRQ